MAFRKIKLQSRCGLVLAAASALALCRRGNPTLAQSLNPKNAVVAAASTREQRARTIAITYKQEVRFAKGGMTEFLSAVAPSKAISRVAPKTDTTVEFSNKLTIDLSKCRFENNEAVWNVAEGRLCQNNSLSVFNGQVAKKLYPNGIGGQATPRGLVLDNRQSMGARTYELFPIISACRGLRPDFTAITLDAVRMGGHQEMHDDSVYLEGSFQVSRTSTLSLWFDPKKDYVLRRMDDWNRGRTVRHLEVSRYEQHDGVWLPVVWKLDEFSDSGSLKKSSTIQVEEIKLNGEIPASQFNFDFPPGCLIYDQVANKYFRVEADGSLNERTARGLPITAGDVKRRSPWMLLSLVLVSFLLIVFLIWTYARRRRTAQP